MKGWQASMWWALAATTHVLILGLHWVWRELVVYMRPQERWGTMTWQWAARASDGVSAVSKRLIRLEFALLARWEALQHWEVEQ